MKAALRRGRARGAILLELALVLLLTYWVAPCALTVGRAMRQQMLLEKAAYAAASRMAALPRLQMGKVASYQQAEAALRAEVLAQLGGEHVDTSDLSLAVVCDTACGVATSLPQRIKVSMLLTVHAAQWDGLSGFLLGHDGLLLRTEVVLRYEN